MPAERDMHSHSLACLSTPEGLVQCQVYTLRRGPQPALSVTLLAGPSWSFLPVRPGLNISLGNRRLSLLLLASGKLDLHSLTTNLFLSENLSSLLAMQSPFVWQAVDNTVLLYTLCKSMSSESEFFRIDDLISGHLIHFVK